MNKDMQNTAVRIFDAIDPSWHAIICRWIASNNPQLFILALGSAITQTISDVNPQPIECFCGDPNCDDGKGKPE